jgi:hypothetical protein
LPRAEPVPSRGDGASAPKFPAPAPRCEPRSPRAERPWEFPVPRQRVGAIERADSDDQPLRAWIPRTGALLYHRHGSDRGLAVIGLVALRHARRVARRARGEIGRPRKSSTTRCDGRSSPHRSVTDAPRCGLLAAEIRPRRRGWNGLQLMDRKDESGGVPAPRSNGEPCRNRTYNLLIN